jgi:hypothetical protein
MLNFEPFLPDTLVRRQIGRRAFEHDLAVAHDVETPGNPQRDGQLLLDEKDRDTSAGDFPQQRADLLDQERG